jgi:hypothetical protein
MQTLNAPVERRPEMAQYAMLIYARQDDENASWADRSEHDRHAEEMEQSGVMVAAFALEPSSTATSIRDGVVTDGPFIDAKEVIAGFAIIEAPDLDAALVIAGRNPAAKGSGGVEVRPVESGGVPARR